MQTSLLNSIHARICQILISELQVDPNLFGPDSCSVPLLGRGIGLDSMETLSLVAALEKEFNIEVPDEDLTVELFLSIGTLSDYILKKLQ